MARLIPKELPDHLRVPWKVLDALLVFLGTWIVVPIIIVLLLGAIQHWVPWAHALLAGLSDSQTTDRSVMANFILAVASAIAGLGLVFGYVRHYKVSWQSLGWRRFKVLQAVGYLLAIFIIFVIGAELLIQLLALVDPAAANQAQSDTLIDGAVHHRWLAIIGLVIVPPIIEETVFRGFIFPALAKRWGWWPGAIASSVLFGFAHLQANVGLYTFLLGLLLCFMYTRLRSIFPGMALHMINNYLAFLALTGPK